VSVATAAPRRMKICIVQYNASRFLTRVDRAARALAEAGHEVVLVAIAEGDSPLIEQREGYAVKRVRLASRSWPRWTRPARWIEAIVRTYRAASAERADVYNPRDIYPMLAAQLAAWRRRARVVTDSDELNLYRNWPWTSAWWWKPLAKPYEGFFLRRAAANITSDDGRADVLVREYGIPRPVVILNVPDVFEPGTPDEEFRARALGSRSYLLIYQGGLVPNRGLPELVLAMHKLPDCALVLLGMGHLRDELRSLIEAEGLSDRVTLIDAVPWPEMVRMTASSDIGVIPIVDSCLSYRYAAPNKLFEDMMAGVPVVASDLPDMARVVRSECVGTLIEPPVSPESIAAAVRALIEGEESLHAIGARARTAALARYNWALERGKLLAVYDGLSATLRPALARHDTTDEVRAAGKASS